MSHECRHENVPRYDARPIVVTEEQASAQPLRMAWEPPRIVACPDCGAPVDRGRFTAPTFHPWARPK